MQGSTASTSANAPDDVTTSVRSIRIPAGASWMTLGFILGAAFWHLVGFWGFLSHVVLHDRADGSPSTAIVRKNDVLAATKKAAIEGSRTCAKLVRDRSGGSTRAEPCDPNDPILHYSGLALRDDLGIRHAATGWTASAESVSGPEARASN